MGPDYPWLGPTATGAGPFPGDDPLEAAKIVVGELEDMIFLPTLPARGPGADAVGRTAALLVDWPVELHPSGWRVASASGRDERRARTLLASDLDALEEAAQGFSGDLKTSFLGPWSLAASMELARGEKLLVDRGAVEDLAGSLREGLIAHTAELRARIEGIRRVVVQLDEPLLPDILRGRLPTASGWGRLDRPEEPVVIDTLSKTLAAAGDVAGVRCNVASSPVMLLHEAGARYLAVDVGVTSTMSNDDWGNAFADGMGLLLGCVPLERQAPDARDPVDLARRWWRHLGLTPGDFARAVAITPAQGLERRSPEQAAEVLRRTTEAARDLEPEQ